MSFPTLVRFGRAKDRCERCGRPHGRKVHHLGDGRWWDEARGTWIPTGRTTGFRRGWSDPLGLDSDVAGDWA